MSMTVAELFVNLGVKGATQLGKTLTGVQDGLKKTAELSFAAKAGIFAAIVGLEELTRFAVGTAIDLKNFSGATGLSTDALQKWGYIARMNNVSGEELAGTILGLQSAQAKMAMGQGAPAGALFFGLDPNKNPLDLIDQISKKIRAVSNDPRSIGIAREMAASLGISSNMFAMMRTGQMGLQGFTKEMSLTTDETKKLLGLDREWSRFWAELKGTGQKSIANNFADPITSFVHLLSNDVKEASYWLDELSKAFRKVDSPGFEKSMKAIGAGLLIAFAPLAPFTAALIALAAILDDIHKFRTGEDSVLGSMVDSPAGKAIAKNPKKGIWNFLSGGEPKEYQKDTPKEQEEYNASMLGMVKGVGNFLMNGAQKGGDTVTHNRIEINGAQHPKAVADELQKHVARAAQKSRALSESK